jgi:surface antigen
VILIGGMMTSACISDMTNNPKATGGTLLGAAGGALLGSQVGGGKGKLVGVALGTLAGAFVGRSIGQSLDNADKLMMERAESQAHSAPVGQTIAWRNPQSGHAGTITPVRDGYDTAGSYCRQYQQTVMIDGRQEMATGTVCKDSAGRWVMRNS